MKNYKEENGITRLTLIISIVIVLVVIGGCVATYALLASKPIKAPTPEVISTEALFTKETYPSFDASTATQPLATAFMSNFTGTTPDEEEFNYSTTHPAYEKLINNEVDFILVTEPSSDELKLAKEKGIELEVIPVVKEGFVFYVNEDNPVNSLTFAQVQRIYSGEITNWKQVGGNDSKITALQRPANSGSQTGLLSLVMKGLKLIEAEKEAVAEDMREIINIVSSYDNGLDSIGYSYYYYANTMYSTLDNSGVDGAVKLLDINGVKPTASTIQDGTYPIGTAYYVVINKNEPQNSDVRKLIEVMLSERGQKVAEDAGYVRVK